ncbi:RICIN domain-containing protein [Streptomyces sp. NPDC102437]|uniref:RICIN domain-containing protein n=1 Tax=Streptomyces sp. NPDC102437 TaxID=3366175 RepID=UPI0037FC8CB2
MRPDPRAARTPAEFVAMMRQLRNWADLSFRTLERKAREAGDTLPRTTIAGVLARQDLPREEVLTAFVRACGGDAVTIDAWLDTRRRLATSLETLAPARVDEEDEALPVPEPGPVAGTDTAPSHLTGTETAGGEGETSAEALPPAPASAEAEGRKSRTRYLPMTLVGTFAGAGAVLFVLWPGGDKPVSTQPSDGPRSPSPSASKSLATSSPPVLPPGIYQMRTADGRCVAERRPPEEKGMAGSEYFFFQTSCTTGESTKVRLDESKGTYRIVFPGRDGEPDRCLGINDASTADGAPASIMHCGPDSDAGDGLGPDRGHGLREAEQFRLKKVTAHGGGFQIRAEHLRFVPQDQRPDLCLGSPDADTRNWSDMGQLRCLSSARQIFQFLPAK